MVLLGTQKILAEILIDKKLGIVLPIHNGSFPRASYLEVRQFPKSLINYQSCKLNQKATSIES